MTTHYYLGDESSSDTITTEGDIAVYNEPKYGAIEYGADDDVGDLLLLYTLPTDNSLLYSFNVDWDGDGEYDGFNEADNLTKWSSSRGRERVFAPSGRGFQPYEIGRLTVTLDNKDGRYDPWNTSGPLYGNLMPGRDMEFKIAYPSTSATGTTVEYVFTGTVVDIQVGGYKKTVNIICEDGWRFLADWHFVYPPATSGSFGVSREIKQVLTGAWPTSYGLESAPDIEYPWGYAFEFGDTSTDLPRHWWWDGSAKQAIEMITFGSLGRSLVRSDGQFDFCDFRETTDASVLSLDEDNLLKNVYLPAPWDNLYSRVVLKGSNNYSYAIESVTRLFAPLKINAGQTVSFSLRTSSTDLDIDGDYCTRITGVNVAANTTTATTDTDLTSDFTYTVDPLVRSFKVSVTNSSTDNGYLNEFEIAGELLDVVDTEWTYETTSAYRASDFILDNPWLSVTAIGSTDDYFEETSTTLDDRARVNTVGETLKSYLSTVKAYPVIQIQGRWEEQFILDLEDKIALTIGTLNIDDDYRVSKIRHESLGTPQDVRTTYWLYPVMTPVEST